MFSRLKKLVGLIVFCFAVVFYIPNVAAKQMVDNNPDMINTIEGPRTFKLFTESIDKKGVPQRIHVLTLDVDRQHDSRNRSGYGNLIPSAATSRRDLRDLTLQEAEKMWGSAKPLSRYTYLFSLTTEDHLPCRFTVYLNKTYRLKIWQAIIDGVGGVNPTKFK